MLFTPDTLKNLPAIAEFQFENGDILGAFIKAMRESDDAKAQRIYFVVKQGIDIAQCDLKENFDGIKRLIQATTEDGARNKNLLNALAEHVFEKTIASIAAHPHFNTEQATYFENIRALAHDYARSGIPSSVNYACRFLEGVVPTTLPHDPDLAGKALEEIRQLARGDHIAEIAVKKPEPNPAYAGIYTALLKGVKEMRAVHDGDFIGAFTTLRALYDRHPELKPATNDCFLFDNHMRRAGGSVRVFSNPYTRRLRILESTGANWADSIFRTLQQAVHETPPSGGYKKILGDRIEAGLTAAEQNFPHARDEVGLIIDLLWDNTAYIADDVAAKIDDSVDYPERPGTFVLEAPEKMPDP